MGARGLAAIARWMAVWQAGQMTDGSGSIPAFLLDAFPACTFGGNGAGVVLLEGEAPEWWLQGVAAELAVPTTGFVDLPSARSGAAQARFFTPSQEISVCGHVTVAIAVVLAERGIWHAGPAAVTASGRSYPLVLSRDGSGVQVEMRQQLQHLERLDGTSGIESLLGQARLSTELQPVRAGTGLRHLLVPVACVEDLALLAVQADNIASLSDRLDVDTIGVFSLADVSDREVEVRMRDLCAGIGATEEPASGTTTGTLAFALADAGVLTPQRPRVRMHMGIEMGRPSRLSVDLDFDGDRAVLARLYGRATRVLTGTLDAPFESHTHP